MKIKLEYIDGKVETTNTGGLQGLSPLFKDYYKEIRDTYEKHMKRIEDETDRQLLSKLKIELELKEK